jgi:hypothetical protein
VFVNACEGPAAELAMHCWNEVGTARRSFYY